jgi:hypothetical protein
VTLISPARAADTVETVASALRAHARMTDARHGATFTSIVNAVNDMSPLPGGVLDGLSREDRLHLVHAAQDLVTVRRWQTHRTVYTIDSGLTAELADTDPESVVPGGGDLLRQLPHINPFLVLPEPIVLPIGDGQELTRYDGGFLYGLGATDERLLPTNHDDAERLGLMFCGRVLTPDGRPQINEDGIADYVFSRMMLPAASMSMGALIQHVRQRFTPRDELGEMPERPQVVDRLVGVTVPIIVYVCAANAERRTAPGVATRKVAARSGRRSKPPRV